MKRFFLVIILLVFFIFGFWVISIERLKDEYIYTLRINSLILKNSNDNVNHDLNNLLYLHANRYFNYRVAIPNFLIEEIDGLFCSAFNVRDDYLKYKTLLTKPRLFEYLKDGLNFCYFEPLTESKITN